jgi:hypothetical protein
MARTTRTPKPAYRPFIRATRTLGVFQVQSESEPSVMYTTDAVLETCSCKAGEYRRRCKHITRSQGVFDALLRVRAAIRAQQRRQAEEAAGAFPAAA